MNDEKHLGATPQRSLEHVPEAVPQLSHAETWVGACPRDGHEYDNQCARCGSSVMPEACDNCGGDGCVEGDCFEDSCCCTEEHDYETCDWCGGRGHFWVCLSSEEWCQSHPREGREQVASGTPEWFRINRSAAPRTPKAERADSTRRSEAP